MKPKRYKFPTSTSNWINYIPKTVFIFELTKDGNTGIFQADGTSCLQKRFIGNLLYKFSSSLKYFNTKIWDKKTCWASDESIVYFDLKRLKTNRPPCHFCMTDEQWKNLNDYCNIKGVKSIDILELMKNEIESKIGKEIKFDFENTNYGVDWYEAYLPIKIKNKKYLVTWMNCD